MIANKSRYHQLGFTLIEIMIGLAIGLLATLVIMQVFSVFEGRKRSTTGSSDAQVNGSIALYSMQRDLQMAGFGLPMFNKNNPPLLCNPTKTVDHDAVASTPNIDMFPVQIIDSTINGTSSDTIRVRYSTDGSVAKGGVAVRIKDISGAIIGVDNNLNCNNNDVVLFSNGATCGMTRVSDTDLATDTTHITVLSTTGAALNGSIGCMGAWNQFTYTVVNNQLQRNDASSATALPMISDIVNIQAQYGVSIDAANNKVEEWVSATGKWDNPSVANRNLIKAIHIAVVARNGQYEKELVTTTAPVAWNNIGSSAAPTIDLSADANWQHYRYRVYETIVPLKNIVWTRSALEN